ncbi:MAG TPA: hypothetical protein VFS44_12060 [Gemmatimonadaceae bacterium]|nr:hypothetical protein [Gemmatimonadaceae bacterium]
MAEVLIRFDEPIHDSRGRGFAAQVCGRVAHDGMWEGWVEYQPIDGGEVLRSPRETSQPNRHDLEYWATGLSVAYLEGALDRARRAAAPRVEEPAPVVRAFFSEPAPPAGPAVAMTSRAVLDPFAVHAQGEQILRSELQALSRDQLVNVADAYALVGPEAARSSVSKGALVDAIVAAVRLRVESGQRR